MTRDQNGTWEMESNENFEGYMKALGKEETGDGEGSCCWKYCGLALRQCCYGVRQTCVQILMPHVQLCNIRQIIKIL